MDIKQRLQQTAESLARVGYGSKWVDYRDIETVTDARAEIEALEEKCIAFTNALMGTGFAGVVTWKYGAVSINLPGGSGGTGG